jgi:phosphotransferase system  glucose/maltose/N-acetylglucosamine-specific IIC component
MPKYDKFNPRASAGERTSNIHPIWQGIGCLMMILIPVMAYAGAVLLVQANVSAGWVPMSYEFTQTVTIPKVGSFEYLFANLLVAVALAMLGFGVVVAIYSLVYRIVGPPRLGPLDADPIRKKPSSRKK